MYLGLSSTHHKKTPGQDVALATIAGATVDVAPGGGGGGGAAAAAAGLDARTQGGPARRQVEQKRDAHARALCENWKLLGAMCFLDFVFSTEI